MRNTWLKKYDPDMVQTANWLLREENESNLEILVGKCENAYLRIYPNSHFGLDPDFVIMCVEAVANETEQDDTLESEIVLGQLYAAWELMAEPLEAWYDN
jgi:hypothetical protein